MKKFYVSLKEDHAVEVEAESVGVRSWGIDGARPVYTYEFYVGERSVLSAPYENVHFVQQIIVDTTTTLS